MKVISFGAHALLVSSALLPINLFAQAGTVPDCAAHSVVTQDLGYGVVRDTDAKAAAIFYLADPDGTVGGIPVTSRVNITATDLDGNFISTQQIDEFDHDFSSLTYPAGSPFVYISRAAQLGESAGAIARIDISQAEPEVTDYDLFDDAAFRQGAQLTSRLSLDGNEDLIASYSSAISPAGGGYTQFSAYDADASPLTVLATDTLPMSSFLTASKTLTGAVNPFFDGGETLFVTSHPGAPGVFLFSSFYGRGMYPVQDVPFTQMPAFMQILDIDGDGTDELIYHDEQMHQLRYIQFSYASAPVPYISASEQANLLITASNGEVSAVRTVRYPTLQDPYLLVSQRRPGAGGFSKLSVYRPTLPTDVGLAGASSHQIICSSDLPDLVDTTPDSGFSGPAGPAPWAIELTDIQDFDVHRAAQRPGLNVIIASGRESGGSARMLISSFRLPVSIRGDVNNDGLVDISDATVLTQALFSHDQYPKWRAIRDSHAADANDDGRVDISDIVVILGTIFSLPEEGEEWYPLLPDPSIPGLDPTP